MDEPLIAIGALCVAVLVVELWNALRAPSPRKRRRRGWRGRMPPVDHAEARRRYPYKKAGWRDR
jgi:hypothetical protein